jgi:RNA polymerase primary sigma factor
MLKWFTDTETLTPEREVELADLIAQGDEDARDALILCNLRLAIHIAGSFYSSNSHLSYDEYVSEAVDGLIEAAGRFEPDKGAKFSTYASIWINQRIKRALIEQAGPVRIPASVGRYKLRIKNFIADHKEETGYPPTLDQLKEEFPDVPKKRLRDLCHVMDIVYMDAPVVDGEIGQVLELVPDDKVELPITKMMKEEVPSLIKDSLECLTPREQEIIICRYGLFGNEEETLETVANRLGLTRERIRQIQNKAQMKLRKEVKKRL